MSENDPIHPTSLKSLIECYVSGEASAAQAQELEQRLVEDENARDEYLKYVNLHASLRRWFLTGDEEPSLDAEFADLPQRLSRERLENVGPRPRRFWFAALVIVSCAVLSLVLSQATWFRRPDASSEADLPSIVRIVGEVRVTAESGGSRGTAIGESMGVGAELLVEAVDEVVLRYTDGTEIELVGAARLAVDQSPQGGKQLQLRSGAIHADVVPQPAGRPLWIVTPHARFRVLGTRFELAADSDDGTRLDLESGRVELLRGVEKPVPVEPHSIAIIPSTPDPIRITPWPTLIDSPQREAAFPGLKSARFSQDGSTVVAATRWQAVYWHDDDRLEALPFSPRGKKGIFFAHQSEGMLMFKNTEPQELVIWDAFTRSPIHVVQDYVDLPNQDHAEIDEEKGWRHPTFVAALSPLGDWVAFQQGRYFRLWVTARQRWLDYAKRYDGRPMQAMASSEDGRLLAIAVRRNTIDVIRPFDGQVVASWEIRQLVPMSLAFSANGQRLAIGFVGRLKVYDVVSGDEIAAYHQPARMFHRVAISPNGRVVAASSLSARVWMWDLESHSELPMLDVGGRVCDLAFAADSKRLAVVAEGSMSVWQVGGEKVQNSNPESR